MTQMVYIYVVIGLIPVFMALFCIASAVFKKIRIARKRRAFLSAVDLKNSTFKARLLDPDDQCDAAILRRLNEKSRDAGS